MVRVTTLGQGAKGTIDWQPHEVVIDVPADADGLSIGAVLQGVGTLGVDDASLEVVDPSKTVRLPETQARLVKRARELAEALGKIPDRPQILDFER
jgi:hypothetical protein